MILACVAGVWLTIALGGLLTPPPNLGGTWELTAPDQPDTQRYMTIQQSGRHLQMNLDGRPLEAKVQSGKFEENEPLVMSAGNTQLTFTPTTGQNRYSIDVRGDQPARYEAHRTSTEIKPPAPPAKVASGKRGHGPIFLLLIQVVLILALSRIMGLIFARMNQPQVMGEMIAGIMLGPSLMGLAFPGASAWLFPADSIPYLNVLSQVGVILFLFLVGLELENKHLRNRGHTALVMSHVSIVAPFLLGAFLTLLLYQELFQQSQQMRFSSVALFMGAAMSITAFPVLARILTERNLHKSSIGALTITCAAVDDVTAWCMLAFVIGIARADGFGPGVKTAGLSLIYVSFMFLAVRPFLKRLERVYDRQGRLTQPVMALIFLLILSSAWTTEWIGIHALFGAFLVGALMPKGTQFVRSLTDKLEDFTVLFLLPIFFAYTGLRTQIGLLNSGELWLYTVLIVFVACAGKFGGCAIAGRACGLGWREASAVGTLMNTRGLMELVILNIGLQEGFITPAIFAMIVIMALVTTALTTPLLAWSYPNRLFEEEQAKALAAEGAFTVLIPVSLPESGAAMARMASLFVKPNGKLLALFLRRSEEAQPLGAALDTTEPASLEPLQPLLEEAQTQSVPVEPISFVSRDVAGDISTVAAARHANLVIIGFHKPVFGKKMLGGTVHRVLSQCESDVGIFVDRGFEEAHRILVPFLGGQHDRLALDLAARIGRSTSAQVTVLHVVPPMRGSGRQGMDVRGTVDRTFADPAQPSPVDFRVIEDDSPVTVVLREAINYDLVLLGVSEEWGLESRLFGWRPERIARECPASLLILRKAAAPMPAQAPVTPAVVTT